MKKKKSVLKNKTARNFHFHFLEIERVEKKVENEKKIHCFKSVEKKERKKFQV